MNRPNSTAVNTLFQLLRSLLADAEYALAKQCTVDGKLDGAQLDVLQLPCFELAWASAELLAAQTALDSLDAQSHILEQDLALTYAAEAVASLRSRLDSLYAALGLSFGPLSAVVEQSAHNELLTFAASGAVMSATAELLNRHPDTPGDVRLAPDHSMISEQFRRFAREVVAPLAERIHCDNETVPEALLQPLRELGVFGLSIPERFGGIAPDDREDNPGMIAVTEALSEASLAAAGSLITRPEILSRALLAGGTEEQKQHWLPKLATGETLCAIAITEPDYGSDVASLSIRATPCDGGWTLNGSKSWCTFAGKAGVIMVVSRTNAQPGHRGLSLLLAEKPSFEGESFDFRQDDGGRMSGRAIPTIGYRGMHSFDLSFEDFFVPAANLIGEAAGEGKGFYYTMAGMTGGRMQTSARACGVMRAALTASIQYSGERKVFGKTLNSFPLTAAKLVKMAARYAASRQLTYAVGRMLDAGEGRMQASMVKLFTCRSAEYLTREALQIHGGMGYAEECAVSRYFVDARVLSIFEGAEETLALKVISRSLLEAAIQREAA